jgi:hypothetical protein
LSLFCCCEKSVRETYSSCSSGFMLAFVNLKLSSSTNWKLDPCQAKQTHFCQKICFTLCTGTRFR